MSLQRLRETKAIRKICEFQRTPYYIACIAAAAFLSHVFGLDLVYFWLIGVTGIFTLIFNDDTTPFIPLACMAVFGVSRKLGATSPDNPGILATPLYIGNCVAIGILAVGAIIFHIVYYKKAKTFWNWTFIGVGLAALSFGLITNGFFAKDYNPLSLPFGLSYVLLYFGVYLLFFHTVKWQKGFSMRYLSFMFFAMGIVIAAELGALYIELPELRNPPPELSSSDMKNLIWLGWSLSNSIAFVFMLIIPFSFYLVYNEKVSLPYYIGIVVMMVAVVFTYSRASLLVTAPTFIGGTIFCCIKAKSKKQLWIGAGVLLAAAIAFVAVKWNWLIDKLAFFIETGFSDRNRFNLWKYAIEAFLGAPIFGQGLMWKFGEIHTFFFWAHNTPLQFLFSGGIVGLGTYLFHRVQTGFLFFKKPTFDRMFMGIAILCLLVNSLLDGAMNCQHMLIYYSVILAFAEKDLLCKTGRITENGEWIEKKLKGAELVIGSRVKKETPAAVSADEPQFTENTQSTQPDVNAETNVNSETSGITE